MINQIQDFKSGITLIVKDRFKETIERESGGKNTVIYDAEGFPNIMYVLPAFSWEDVEAIFPDYQIGLTGALPAFLDKDGNLRKEIFIGKYMASLNNGKLVSTPNAIPFISETSLAATRLLVAEKGSNWHLLSIHEYTAILLRMRMLFGYDENAGNSSNGRNFIKPFEVGRIVGGSIPGQIGSQNMTYTGSGPITWNHDRTEYGISDFQGNGWETLDQAELIDGILHVTQFNDRSSPLLQTSTCFDSTNVNGGGINWSHQINNRNGEIGNDSFGVSSNIINGFTIEPGYSADNLTKAVLMHPVFPDPHRGLNVRNYGRRAILAGGGYGASNASTNSLRSHSMTISVDDATATLVVGYRLAYY